MDRREGKEGSGWGMEGLREKEERKKGDVTKLRRCDNGRKMEAGKNYLCLFWLHLERKLENLSG